MKETPQPFHVDFSRRAIAVDGAGAVAWTTGMLRKGLSQVYAVHLAECFETKHHARLVERWRQDSANAAVTSELEAALAGWLQADPTERIALVERLGPIIFAGVDRVLEQAQVAGRDRTGVHLAAARFGLEVVILADPDPHQAWLLPTTQTRLREALAELGVYPTAAETQELDLAQGDTLQLLGHEFRLSAERHGGWRVQCQPMRPSTPWQQAVEALGESTGPRAVPDAATAGGPPAKRAGKRSRIPSPQGPPGEPEAEDREVNAGTTAMPQPLSPAEPPLSSEREPQRWSRGSRLGRGLELLRDLPHRARSIQVGWRHLPITLYPVLGFMIGWNSMPAWLCVALVVTSNRRGLSALAVVAGRHWVKVGFAVGGIAAACVLWFELSDIYGNMSREVAASGLPAGFYLGQYNLSWDRDPVPYGLYVPPHFRKARGPFPLIVFLHGYGEKSKSRLFIAGLPRSIADRFGAATPNGPFDFVALFPLDPKGMWRTGDDEVQAAMQVVDYVIQRHSIDPARVYLTGHSTGGSGVWSLAQAYPNTWAAVVPVASFTDPDVATVRHLPAWIFHGRRDRVAPVARERGLVERLKEVQADVRYTEVPDQEHVIWRSVYDSKELYNWLATKVRKY